MLSSLELAKICGVSQGTVDRALHDRPGISQKTRQRILQAAAKYGYVPNPSAHEMIRGESSIVGAITPAFNSLFFSDLFEHLQRAIQPSRLRLAMTAASTQEVFLQTLQDFAARRCRAAVVIPPADDMHIPETLTSHMRVISFVSRITGENTFCLAPDEIRTGRNAVDYLYQQGHRKITHVTYTREAQGIRERSEGYQQRMRELKLEPHVLASTPDCTMAQQLKERGVTAIFVHNDWLAIALLQQLQQIGLRVPADISVLGVDDSPTFTRIVPDLTTMHYPFAELAGMASDLIAGGNLPDIQKLKLSVIERSTVRRIIPA